MGSGGKKSLAAVLLLALAVGGWPQANEQFQPSRLHFRLTLHSPMTDARANAEWNISVQRLSSFGIEQLGRWIMGRKADTLPARLLFCISDLTLAWGALVFFHEAAHYRVAAREGGDPRIDFRWFHGMTYFNWPEEPVPEIMAETCASGINSSETSARELDRRLVLGEGTGHADLTAYLVNQLHGTFYLLRSLQPGASVSGGDDNHSWNYYLKIQGITPPDMRDQLGRSLAADMLSVDTWAALLALSRYLINGRTVMSWPTWKIGRLRGSFPHFSYFRTAQSEVIEAKLYLQPQRPTPVELSLALAVDGEGWRLGGRWLNIASPINRLHLSPSLALDFYSESGQQPLGFDAGIELDWRLFRQGRIFLAFFYGRDDLLRNRIWGYAEKWQARLGMELCL